MADTTKPNTTTSTPAPAERKAADGVEFDVESTAARDLRERLANDNAYDAAVKTLSPGEQLDDPTVDRSIDSASEDDKFIGVDPIYQNYANENEKPLAAESGVFKDAEEEHLDAVEAKGQDTPDDLKAAYADRSNAVSSDKPAGGTGTRTAASTTTTSAK